MTLPDTKGKFEMRPKLLILQLVLASLFAATVEAEEKEYIWYGALDVKVMKLRTIIKVTEKDGKLSASGQSPDQDPAWFDFDSFAIDGQDVTFEIGKLNASFKGKLNDKKDELTGTFSQRGQAIKTKFWLMDKMPSDQPESSWQGTLKAGPQTLKLQFRFFKMPDGSMDVKFDSVSQNAMGIGATHKVDGKKHTFDMPLVKAKYEATISDDGKKLKGDWLQGGGKFPFEMELGTDAAKPKKPNRPQEPKGPFPYSSMDVEFPGGAEGVTLAGTLTLPKEGSKFAAAILVSGSGPQDRNETLMGHKPFWVIADYLTRRGIAVLRYDDRGTAKSTGDFGSATSTDLASDAEAAFKYLKTRDEIDAKKIGIIGHSEGGLIGPMVAQKNADLKYIVMLAGPGVDGGEIIKSQSILILKAEGATELELSGSKKMTEAMLEVVRKTEDSIPTKELVQRIADKSFEKMNETERKEIFDETSGDLKPEVQAGLMRATTKWFREFIKYDPQTALKNVKCAVLALNGELDLQVDPKLNLPKIKSALESAGNSNFKIVELPKLNHLFQKCETGAVSEYQQIEETFSEEALELMYQWLKGQI